MRDCWIFIFSSFLIVLRFTYTIIFLMTCSCGGGEEGKDASGRSVHTLQNNIRSGEGEDSVCARFMAETNSSLSSSPASF